MSNLGENENKAHSSDTWSAAQYSKFEQERNRPIADLLSQIKLPSVLKAVDLGCGPGNSTSLLSARFPGALLSGIDSSVDMIAAAKKRMPLVDFQVDDISNWESNELYDIILANAALQWVPDHKTLFPKLIDKLNNGGILAVQMPDNFEEPAHQLMRSIAEEGPWKSKLADASTTIARESALWYYDQLNSQVSKLDIWRTTYFHPMAGAAKDIVEWFKGTGLRPFLDPLTPDEKALFLEHYTNGISEVYQVSSDGSILLPYPRLFIIAQK